MYVKTKTGIDKILPESRDERNRKAWARKNTIKFERARAAERAALHRRLKICGS